MSEWRITEEQLHAANVLIQRSDDVLVHNCVTRTAQESKLFPILPYLDMIMIDTYWRYPDLLRKAMQRVSPEDVGHRIRNVTTTQTRLTSWSTLNYYLNGRSLGSSDRPRRWLPEPGAHRLEIRSADGRVRDSVRFVVRGAS